MSYKNGFGIFLLITLIILYPTQIQSQEYATKLAYQNLEGEIISLETFAGSSLLITAIATWCPQCQAQHSELVKIYEANITNLEMLTLSVDPSETIETMTEFNNSYPSYWPIGLDINGSLADEFSVNALPTIILLNPKGILLNEVIGFTEAEVLIPLLPGSNSSYITDNITSSTTTTTNNSSSSKLTSETIDEDNSNQLIIGYNPYVVIFGTLSSFVVSVFIIDRSRRYYY